MLLLNDEFKTISDHESTDKPQLLALALSSLS